VVRKAKACIIFVWVHLKSCRFLFRLKLFWVSIFILGCFSKFIV